MNNRHNQSNKEWEKRQGSDATLWIVAAVFWQNI